MRFIPVLLHILGLMAVKGRGSTEAGIYSKGSTAWVASANFGPKPLSLLIDFHRTALPHWLSRVALLRTRKCVGRRSS
jgi:hypothetical protein